MTIVTFHKSKDGQIKGFDCIGHAGFRRKGYDIVCAAISSLVINTVNSIEVIAKDNIKTVSNEDEGLIYCSFPEEPNEISKILLSSLELGISQIEKKNSKYCRMKIKEV